MREVRIFLFWFLLSVTLISLTRSQRIDYDLGDDDDGQYRPEPPTSSTPEPVYPDGVNTIPGDPGINYPTYESIIRTSFSCEGRDPGFYADLETQCQVWHICDVDSRMQSFLCTNGTIFNQATRVCEWWYNSNCEANDVQRNYQQNKELYKEYKGPELVRSNPPAPKSQEIQSQKPSIQIQTSRKEQNQQRFDENPRRKEKPIVLNLQHQFQVAHNSRETKEELNDRAVQTRQQSNLPQAVLEERRQAARDQFYSTAARTLQENRIKQLPPVSQQSQSTRFTEFPVPPNPTKQSQTVNNNNRFQEVAAPKPVQTINTGGPFPSEKIGKQKFRHSTPRKHNVRFAATRSYQESNDERQVPEETKQTGFPYYNNPFQYNKFETKVIESSEQINGYLPTLQSPTTKSIDIKIIPKPAQNYRPPPIFQPFTPPQPQSNSKSAIVAADRENLLPRRIPAPNKLPPGSTKIIKNGRVVIKRRKLRKNISRIQPQQNQNFDNIISFPGNPHLENKVSQDSKKNHTPQKRCVVHGDGITNSFKIIC